MIADLWYKNAVIYCLDVEKYLDANGDGTGDFAGLTRRLDYLAGLGITCLWLQPFYPSPNKDNGYDVSDYYGIHPKHGNSLLNWTERTIRMRKECPEISWGAYQVIECDAPGVLLMRYDWMEHSLLIAHNFSGKPQAAHVRGGTFDTKVLVSLLTTEHSVASDSGHHVIELEPHGYRWFRAGGFDRNVPRPGA